MKTCDETCKYFESMFVKIKLSTLSPVEEEIVLYLPICRKFTRSLAIIRCQHYSMR
jgi:hypothetical protein